VLGPPPPDQPAARQTRAWFAIAGIAAVLIVPIPMLIARRQPATDSGAVVQLRAASSPTSPVVQQQPSIREEALPVTGDSGPFTERVTELETPEIVVDDQREWPRVAGSVRFYSDSEPERVLEFDGRPGTTSIQVPAGEYRYELRALRYWRIQEADQSGTFRCRRFRRYDITLSTIPTSQWTPHEDLGDPN
jgi:hypothetical protein